MPVEPQRFIHAANIRLDVPVSVQTAETLTDELRQAFEDATNDSFDFVIDQCIDRQVDYLLLSGNVFIESERSLRARLALLRGCERLQKAGIPVVVIPGVSDPPEAWRAIPELPDNVLVSYSAHAEPVEIWRDDSVIATVSASLWYGTADSFGIQVIGTSEDVVQPFRIGTVSESGYREARRMAEVSRVEQADGMELNVVSRDWTGADSDAGSEGDESHMDDESLSLDVAPSERTEWQGSEKDSTSQTASNSQRVWEAGFVHYVDETFREGRLSYLALTDELKRTTLRRGSRLVHAPGTTQPRHSREAAGGTCSLLQVDAAGTVEIEDINASAVDWKDLEIQVDPLVTMTSLLQQMKTMLTAIPCNAADCIWSVGWTLRGPLPVLQSLQEEDIDVAVAVELDVLEVDDAAIELLHAIRIVPDEWSLDDSDSLGQQYAEFIGAEEAGSPLRLRSFIKADQSLTKGWQQRLMSLLPSVDGERIRSQLRVDGADWFVDDPAVLMPQMLQTLTEQPDELTEEDGDWQADEVEAAALEGEWIDEAAGGSVDEEADAELCSSDAGPAEPQTDRVDSSDDNDPAVTSARSDESATEEPAESPEDESR